MEWRPAIRKMTLITCTIKRFLRKAKQNYEKVNTKITKSNQEYFKMKIEEIIKKV